MYFPLLIQIAQSTLEIHYNLHKYFTYTVFRAVREIAHVFSQILSKACSILLSIIRKLDSQTKTKQKEAVNCQNHSKASDEALGHSFLVLAISNMEIKLSISLLPHLQPEILYHHSTIQHLYFWNISTILIRFQVLQW